MIYKQDKKELAKLRKERKKLERNNKLKSDLAKEKAELIKAKHPFLTKIGKMAIKEIDDLTKPGKKKKNNLF